MSMREEVPRLNSLTSSHRLATAAAILPPPLPPLLEARSEKCAEPFATSGYKTKLVGFSLQTGKGRERCLESKMGAESGRRVEEINLQKEEVKADSSHPMVTMEAGCWNCSSGSRTTSLVPPLPLWDLKMYYI
ncbi:hypothetical protein Taro_028615 [Colocasia esculenta]|uniref:Uncharacterized protein n=1 Tax=Colocasia esculenta TaxID=4460 RepID=A0A843VLK6_COLES|nr:hypothetical protein [Colocasia esculenta]